MSQSCSRQKKIDDFYKVVYNKNTGCGVKLDEFFTKKSNGRRNRRSVSIAFCNSMKLIVRNICFIQRLQFYTQLPLVRQTKKNFPAMSSLVESEVQILSVKKKARKNSQQRNSQKRSSQESPSKNLENSQPSDISQISSQESPSSKSLANSQQSNSSSQNKRNISQESPSISPKKPRLDTASSTNSTPLKVRSPNSINSSQRKGSFTPKTTPQRNNNGSPQANKFTPRKLFFPDRININNVQQSIENLNLVRQGSIALNEFDLESTYREKEFSIVYSDIVSDSEKFELKEINFPKEKHADHLLMIVMDVFTNPINCGYFFKTELDLIFSLFTLSSQAQSLFVRLLKRKLGWHRINLKSLQYTEISEDLNPFFQELVKNGFCSSGNIFQSTSFMS